MTRERTNPILGLAHLFLSILSGWSLKNVTWSAYYSIPAFSLSLIYSVVGVFRFTHPNPTALRRFSTSAMSSYIQILLSLLITVDILKITSKINLILLGITFFVAISSLISEYRLHWKILNHGFAFWIVILLSYIAYSLEECYWTVGLITLIFLNHFILQRLSTHYEISRLEISTIGLCFFVVFAINSLNEIAATNDLLKNHHQISIEMIEN